MIDQLVERDAIDCRRGYLESEVYFDGRLEIGLNVSFRYNRVEFGRTAASQRDGGWTSAASF